MKILITGAGGFIGSNLVEALYDKRIEINALINHNSKNNWGWLEDFHSKNEIGMFPGDIRDISLVRKAMQGCTSVIHLASKVGNSHSLISPLSYIRTNIEGTYNVLQTALELELESVTIASAADVYGKPQYLPVDEKHPTECKTPYSASKLAAEQLSISYYHSFGLPVKIARIFNVYGPRQAADYIVPTIITQLYIGKTKLELGNIHPSRDLIYVKDAAQALIEINSCDSPAGEIINLGMNSEITMGNLAMLIAGLMQINVEINFDDRRSRPDNLEVDRLVCSNSKLMRTTKWKPKYTLEAGLKETIAWMSRYINIYRTKI